jgi:hypothetical protein
MAQHKDARGYKLQFAVSGFGSLAGKTLRVRIKRANGSIFEKTTASGDVQILDVAQNLIGVKINQGDLTVTGRYQYQAFDETDDAFIPTDTEFFYVDENLAVGL